VLLFKIAYIKAFNAMEASLHGVRDDASETLARLQDECDALKEQLFETTRKLAAVQERYINRVDAPAKPKRVRVAPISEYERHTMRQMAKSGVSNADIARKTGRSAAAISFIVRGYHDA
jgi:hypothetical protein